MLIIGATSEIAYETGKLFAAERAWLFLVGRHPEKLAAVADDLQVRGAGRVEIFSLDLTELDRHQELLAKATEALGGLDAVLIAHGTLPNQRACEQSVPDTMKEFATNCLSVISLVTLLANYCEQQRYGSIAVITSVAGDRGRRSNYVYGAAKGAVDLFLQGVRSRLANAGVSVITIKPGFVDTPMTAALPKNALFASAHAVGKGIYKAMLRPKDVVYLPWFWRWIMAIVKVVPESLFKRMSL
ncbi:SDR family oxidoreductase [Candidatus Methylomirabilis sp.]|uniref:SDR family oxidoreductase n=1 Tax=Candidatus Methylomirabilis sp. TaxID=2032687 RepID=UPI003C70C5AD